MDLKSLFILNEHGKEVLLVDEGTLIVTTQRPSYIAPCLNALFYICMMTLNIDFKNE